MSESARPTSIRYIILALTVCVAVLLYLDRNCLGFLVQYIRENLRLSETETYYLLGAFYVTYAMGQIPCGWLSDRFGTRLMLAFYLAVWSTLTGLMGVAHSFVILVLFRLGCGLFEAGAYPACAGLIRRWIPYQQRGLASGIISIGGRIGGAVTPVVTGYLLVIFMPVSASSLITPHDLLKPRKLARDVFLIPETDKKLLPMSGARTVGLLSAPMGLGSTGAISVMTAGTADNRFPPMVEQVALRLQARLPERARQTFLKVTSLPDEDAPGESETIEMVNAVNDSLKQADLTEGIDLGPILMKLNQQEVELFEPTSSPRTLEEITRRNRRLLEVLFADSIRKIYGDSWQPVLLIYGTIGVLLAVLFWGFYRDTPRQHFLSNEAEAQLVEAHETAPATATPDIPAGVLWKGVFTSLSLWASAVVQIGTNFGWVFLINMMPTYLQRVHQVPEVERGWLTSLPFLVSLPMMIVGGWWTDWMTRKYGPRLGRTFPLASTRFVAAAAFLACVLLQGPWPVTLALCLFSVASDMGLPAIWAYNLDVGGRNVGMILGWGNMWGNLGAAVSPVLLGLVLHHFVDLDGSFAPDDLRRGYNAVFITCAGVFFLIGIASFFVDATKPIGSPAGRK